MSIFKIESPPFQALKEGFDSPASFVGFKSFSGVSVSGDYQVLLVGQEHTSRVEQLAINHAFSLQNPGFTYLKASKQLMDRDFITSGVSGKEVLFNIRIQKVMALESKNANHFSPINSRSPNNHLILLTSKWSINRFINLIRSVVCEFPLLDKVSPKSGKATLSLTTPRTSGLIFNFPNFQLVWSKASSHRKSSIEIKWVTSFAISSTGKTKLAKKRCNRFYLDDVLASPDMANANWVKFTVIVLMRATIKREKKATLALFHVSMGPNIVISFSSCFMVYSFHQKNRNELWHQSRYFAEFVKLVKLVISTRCCVLD